MKRLVLVGLLLTGCDNTVSSTDKVVSIKIQEYDPPKHVYVSFTDLDNGESVDRLYVSKRCSSCRYKKDMVIHVRVKDTVYSDNGRTYIVRKYDTASIKDALSNAK